MNKIKYIALLVVGLGMASCDGMLEQVNPNRPDSDSYWTEEKEVQDALYAAYRPLRFNGEYRRWYHILYVSRSDEGWSNSPNQTFVSYSDFNTRNDDNAEAVKFTWLDTYKGIFWANQVLQNGARVEFADPLDKEKVMGQAHFLRGIGLFNIAGIYGRGPAPVIPDMSEYNQGYVIHEQTALYEEARKSFLEAAKRVPATWSKEETGRITKGAAWGMLAKTAGQLASAYEMNDDVKAKAYWNEMKLYCDSIINSGKYMLTGVDYMHNFNEENEFNSESVFEIQFEPDGNGITQLSQERANFLGLPGNGKSFDDASPRQSVYDELVVERMADGRPDPRLKATLFYNDPSDNTLYYGKTFAQQAQNGTVKLDKVYWKKYTQWYKPAGFGEDHNNNGINIRVIRLADIHLMRAEAMNELGMPQGDILADLNVVRSRVGMPTLPSIIYPASAFDTKEKMRVQIMHERVCELAGESWRWLDLERWFFRDANGDGIRETMVDSYQISGMTPLKWLQNRDSEFNNFDYTDGKCFRLPIPSRELPLVDGLVQNPGW